MVYLYLKVFDFCGKQNSILGIFGIVLCFEGFI